MAPEPALQASRERRAAWRQQEPRAWLPQRAWPLRLAWILLRAPLAACWKKQFPRALWRPLAEAKRNLVPWSLRAFNASLLAAGFGVWLNFKLYQLQPLTMTCGSHVRL